MFASDILKVIYAPHKVFKQIVQNPKYIGVLVIVLLFVAVQITAYYSHDSQNYYELTAPSGVDFGVWTQNATLWTASSGAVITQNYDDAINSTFLGNSSLQFAASNSKTLSIELSDLSPVVSVDCGPTSFQNMSMRIKIAAQQTAPEKVTAYLYSLDSSSYFQYDLTQEFSDAQTLGIWNNLTIPVGTGNWQSSGSPSWGNITGLKLEFTFPTNSDITVRVEGMFFRGMNFQGVYMYQLELGSSGYFIYYFQTVILQFLMEWLLITALIYILVKLLKNNLVWKPLFIAVGFAMTTLIVQALLTLVVSSTGSSLHIPIEVLAGMPEAQAATNAITATATEFTNIIGSISIAVYAWTAGLCTIVVRELLPEFTWSKSALVGVGSMIGTIILTILLSGV